MHSCFSCIKTFSPLEPSLGLKTNLFLEETSHIPTLIHVKSLALRGQFFIPSPKYWKNQKYRICSQHLFIQKYVLSTIYVPGNRDTVVNKMKLSLLKVYSFWWGRRTVNRQSNKQESYQGVITCYSENQNRVT